jgi:acetyl-CoA synthetase
MADIESLLKEKRSFKPSSEFTKSANWSKRTVSELRKLGANNPERFWAKMATENVSWFTLWKKVLDWKPPAAKWFVGGKLNVSYNCLDRHLVGENAWRRNKAAIIWEGEREC